MRWIGNIVEAVLEPYRGVGILRDKFPINQWRHYHDHLTDTPMDREKVQLVSLEVWKAKQLAKEEKLESIEEDEP
jgi:hypothetical protein